MMQSDGTIQTPDMQNVITMLHLALIYTAGGCFFCFVFLSLYIEFHMSWPRTLHQLVQQNQQACCLIKMSDNVGFPCTCSLSVTTASIRPVFVQLVKRANFEQMFIICKHKNPIICVLIHLSGETAGQASTIFLHLAEHIFSL